MLSFIPKRAHVAARRSTPMLFGFPVGSREIAGDVLDMSLKGLRFAVPERVTLCTRLRMHIAFSEVTEALECTGVVRWSHPHARTGLTVLGVEFESISGEQRTLIERVQKAALGTARYVRTADDEAR